MVVAKEEEVDFQIPLLEPSFTPPPSSSAGDLEPAGKRTGNEWTAFAHIITAVIGSGVLSLAWSIAQLGWIAGPLTMLLFACATFTSAFLLCNCYKSPDPETGPDRHSSYVDAVRKILGERNAWFCGVLVSINFVKIGIVYTIAAALSIRAIQRADCYHDQGHNASCGYGSTKYMVIFGLIQVVVSQIPDFQNMEWLSIVATVMSFTYSIIGSALSLAKVIENGEVRGSIRGTPSSTAAPKVWSVAQALGDIAFAFPFSLIFLEIQDTMKTPPSEKATMKKASIMAVCITTFFYLCCGGLGYAAFGSSTPGNLLTGFGFYEPYWLVDFANACVVLHLVGGYQVFTQPLFANVERWFARKFPESKFVHKNHSVKLLPFRFNFLRLVFRTAYIVLITGIAILFPYFNQVVGVSGAINFWPVVIYFPIEMYLAQMKTKSWTSKAISLRLYAIVCLFVVLYAFVGSVRGLIVARFL